ncbi:NAD-dependent epimerase/dehydratase family protein [Primorskyibacter flagellatus]|uniref:Uronate dehydrogenase n=1 Tax=Primorskyibacter flagellatus TaxID=1387277 RepID=A0A1W2D3U2_9RHOB|nr:NAD(P)-dependent oxidoreductase [Primorskyibacter flagellatus]SMC92091.1 uronate dehydrogenase [Primorskyibacter flagellatus]
MKRLLITGAAGGLGSVLRSKLAYLADTLRLSDIADLGKAGPNEELMPCNLSDKAAVEALVKGCDGIVHLGGRSIEDSWNVISSANIDGVFNLYEAARKQGCNRIVFASSNHAIGYYPQNERLDSDVYPRPDSLYGVSKVFGEALANMYHDKFGIETAIVRIGSCLPEPSDHRQLSTWLSQDDFVRLIERAFATSKLGCPVIYGASDNDAGWWDNSKVGYLGWKPQDNSEDYRPTVDANNARPAPDTPEVRFQGGIFTAEGIHED